MIPASLRRFAEAVAFVVRMRASEGRFRRHLHRYQRHAESGQRHVRAMEAEMELRAALCARYGGRPGPTVPRSGSGIPLVPRPSHRVAETPDDAAAAVPGRGGVYLSPEAVGSTVVAADRGPRPV